MSNLVKSKSRIQQFGEVFTPRWMVKKMLDVPEIQEALRDFNTKFIDPCAGEGAFLTEILRRKLILSPLSMFESLKNIYGVEIQIDNLAYTRKNLADIFTAHYEKFFAEDLPSNLQDYMWRILFKNIIHGDALQLFPPPIMPSLFKGVNMSGTALAKVFEEMCGLTEEQIRNAVIITNPPYQADIRKGATSNFATAVYHDFIKAFHKTSDRVMVLHPARCLFNAGSTPKEFNQQLLNDEHITVPIYEPDSNKVFPNAGVDIKGGVAVTYRDVNKNFGKIGTFTPFEELKSIHQKVVVDNKDFQPINEIIYTHKLYKFSPTFYEEHPEARKILPDERTLKTNIFNRMPQFFFINKPEDRHLYAKIYGLQNMKRTHRFFRADYIDNNVNFHKYKVLIPKAYGGVGALCEKGPTMLVGLPLVGSTETFITLGAFDSEAEAVAALKYVKTKFARALLGIIKVTQDCSPKTWAKVPLQDFTADSDIDWSRSIHQIDKQLYWKYNLTAREVIFIETRVKVMA